MASNWNPYWRLAYEYDYDRYTFMVGTYGSYFKLSPGSDIGAPLKGATNNYTDIAEDFQIQFIGEKNYCDLEGHLRQREPGSQCIRGCGRVE